MSRMLNLIRVSALPSNVMQSAARGALAVPPAEMIEILVYLATNNKVFADKARMTLAGWDEAASRAVAADPRTPKEILDYWIAPENLRPALVPALLENPSVSQKALSELAATGSREIVEMMLKSARVQNSPAIFTPLKSNPNMTEVQAQDAGKKLPVPVAQTGSVAEASREVPAEPAPATVPVPAIQPCSPETETTATASSAESTSSDAGSDDTLAAFLTEHASEIAAEANNAFQPIGEARGETAPVAEEAPAEAKAAAASATGTSHATPPNAAHKKKSFLGAGHEKGSALQKIAKLDVKGRIQLGMKGDREERSLLIRDGTKVVALAVLESPKLTDSEAEKFASQKNVLEAVLRAISMKRRFMKQYPVVRNLAFNPRTPIDVSLGLMKHLLIQDLRNLAGNKEVSDTVRKLALKMFKQKVDVASQKK
jgi:hypothetical protein